MVACKKLAIITTSLSYAPGIKSFIKDIHSKSVTGFYKCSRWRIVSCSDSIKALFLELSDLSLLCGIKRYCSQKTIVMVKAASFKLYSLSVYHKASNGICSDSPDSKKSLLFINFFSIFRNKMRPVHAKALYYNLYPV